jgi:signal transduction histidine kinase
MRNQSAIRYYAKTLAHSYATGGLLAMTKSISAISGTEATRNALFLLVDSNGNRIAGNIDEWPKAISRSRRWYILPLKNADFQMEALYRCYSLPGGFKLLVGYEMRGEARLRAILWSGMCSALLEMVLLCFGGGLVIRFIVKRAVADLSVVVDAISEGDLTKRVRLRSNGYEFDRIAKAVNEILDRLIALMDGVRNVSDSIAHDLRTPITRVRVRLEDAMLYASDSHALRKAIELATADLDSLTNLFQALLRISEVESGIRRSAFHEFDLTLTLLALVEMYEAVAEEQDVKLISALCGEMRLVGDDQMIQQAVGNLLGNAIKFSPPGTSVRLSANIEGDFMHIIVFDEGPGIPETDRKRATERFYRAEEARNTPGSGLGLSLVSAVCRLHDGSLLLGDNYPGLEARITLPRYH